MNWKNIFTVHIIKSQCYQFISFKRQSKRKMGIRYDQVFQKRKADAS